MTYQCPFCHQPVPDIHSPSVARAVTGWERPRTAGGTNALMLRKPLPEYAHVACLRMVGDGIDPGGQGKLL